ncbi:MAG: hypothetical protein WC539_07175 [Nitrospirota bacterium]
MRKHILDITSPLSWGDIIIVFVIFIGFLAGFLKLGSVFFGFIALVSLFTLLILIFFRDKIYFNSLEEGMVESTFWTFAGYKKYQYCGLTKAKEIRTIEIGGSDGGIIKKGFLIFYNDDVFPIPGESAVIKQTVNWFKENYGNDLPVIMDNDNDKLLNSYREIKKFKSIKARVGINHD